MVSKLAVSMMNLVHLEIGSWSPFGVDCDLCVFWNCEYLLVYFTPGVMAVWFSWPPLEVGVGFFAGASCLGMSGDIGLLGGLYFSVRQFANIVQTASFADN